MYCIVVFSDQVYIAGVENHFALDAGDQGHFVCKPFGLVLSYEGL